MKKYIEQIKKFLWRIALFLLNIWRFVCQLFRRIRQFITDNVELIKKADSKDQWLMALLVIIVFAASPFICLLFGSLIKQITGRECPELYTFGLSLKDFSTPWIAFWVFVGAGLNALLMLRRIAVMEKQVRETRFASSVELLGNANQSARLGGIYSLYYLALDDEDLRKTICEILCAHVRNITREEDYQERHKEEPSNEIRTILDLLFMKDKNDLLIFDKYHKNLRKTFICGTNLEKATLSNVNFSNATSLSNVNFESATLSDVDFECAVLCETIFSAAKLCNVYFSHATLNTVTFHCALLDKVDFSGAMLNKTLFECATLNKPGFCGATLNNVTFYDATLIHVHFDGVLGQMNWFYPEFNDEIGLKESKKESKLCDVDFACATLSNVNFSYVSLSNVKFTYAKFINVHFSSAKLSNVDFNETVFEGYDYEEITRSNRSYELTKLKENEQDPTATHRHSYYPPVLASG